MKTSSTILTKIFIITVSVAFAAAVLTKNSHGMPTEIVSAAAPARADGAAIFAEHCASCHGSDGRAQTAKGKRKGATDFTSEKWKPNDARMVNVITNGKGNMPSFKDKLNADEIRAAMLFVKTFKK